MKESSSAVVVETQDIVVADSLVIDLRPAIETRPPIISAIEVQLTRAP
jgi:hypothetical protein